MTERLCVESPAAVLAVRGEDAFSYLQSQFSNDLRSDAACPATYGLFLDRKGRVCADAFILRRGPEDFLVARYHPDAVSLRAKVEENIIADEVEIEDVSARWRWVTVWGDGVDLPPEGSFAEEDGALVLRGRHLRRPHREALVPVGVDWPEAASPVRAASAEDLLRARLADGLPAISDDIGPDDLPAEGADLASVAVSYTKGCYLGQEVMARLHAMGRPQRALFRVSGPGALPAGGSLALEREGRTVGELRSRVAGENGAWSGLALLKLRHAGPGVMLLLAGNSTSPVTVEAAL